MLSALYLPNQAPNFQRCVLENAREQFRALHLTVEKKVKQWAAGNTAELQRLCTEPVREWSNPGDQEIKLKTTRPDGTQVALVLSQDLLEPASTTLQLSC